MAEKLTRRAALACLGSGALAMGLGSSAFTSVEASRGVAVDIADQDETALLGIADESGSAEIGDSDDSTVLFELIDNVGGISAGDLSVTVVGITQSDGTVVQTPPLTASIDETVGGADQFGVRLQCSSTTGSLGDSYRVRLQFSATADDASIDAERVTTSAFPISCESSDVVVDGNESGNIDTSGSVDVTKNSRQNGDVSADGSVSVGKNGTVNGSIDAGGVVTLTGPGSTTINGDICASGDIVVGKNVRVNGSVRSKNGSVTLEKNARVSGEVVANQSVQDNGSKVPESRISENVSSVSC
jgi:cytoskeletal protein CcmA (bactofilin family)